MSRIASAHASAHTAAHTGSRTSFISSVLEIVGLAVTAPAHRPHSGHRADPVARRPRTNALPATTRPRGLTPLRLRLSV